MGRLGPGKISSDDTTVPGVVTSTEILATSAGGWGQDISAETGVVYLNAGTPTFETPLAIARGGTAAITAAAARTSLAVRTPWYISGLTISNSGTDATNDIIITAGDCNSNDAGADNRVQMVLASQLIKRLDATWAVGTNQGMLASGAALTDITYHLFLIQRPDTGVVDVAADSSVVGSNIATNTNAAYTKKRRIGSIVRASGAILLFKQAGDYFFWSVPAFDISAVNPGTDAVTRTLTVPTGIQVLAHVHALAGGHASGTAHLLLTDLTMTDTAPTTGYRTISQVAANVYAMSMALVRTNLSGQIRSRFSASDATTGLEITTFGWFDWREY